MNGYHQNYPLSQLIYGHGAGSALDAFAREQRAGLGALARLSRPGDGDLPERGAWDPPWDRRESGDWDPPLAPWAAGDPPYAEEPGIPDVSYRSRGRWR